MRHPKQMDMRFDIGLPLSLLFVLLLAAYFQL